MKGTIYEKDYHTEHQQLMVDNLNMLYVAFTRAAKSLYIIGKRKAKGTRSILIEQVLSKLQFPDITLEGMDNEKQPIVFSFGVMPPKEEKHKDKSNDPNPFIRTSTLIPVDIESYGLKTSFKQSNLSKEFVNDNDDDEMAQQSNYIKMGNVLHNVFAHIRTADDIEQALQGMEMEGILYDANLSPTKILDMIRKRMADPRVADWFSPKWKLYNECTILLPNGEERRPDRVMTDGKNTVVIDFKFGHQREAYRQQVLEYMNLLSQMGHQHVTGFLWFVYSNQIIEVV
jgi:ATP-dependent exoDNAse (exonuclease V) beta subunit